MRIAICLQIWLLFSPQDVKICKQVWKPYSSLVVAFLALKISHFQLFNSDGSLFLSNRWLSNSKSSKPGLTPLLHREEVKNLRRPPQYNSQPFLSSMSYGWASTVAWSLIFSTPSTSPLTISPNFSELHTVSPTLWTPLLWAQHCELDYCQIHTAVSWTLWARLLQAQRLSCPRCFTIFPPLT